MDVISSGPVRAASILWQPAHGGFMLTIVCKSTYVLLPGESQLADEQEYINEDDNHWNDDPARSLYSPSDLVPFKVRADVMLVGHAFAPRGEPVRSLTARLIVGDVDKAIEIFGERVWTQDRKLRETARFTKMPLRYERAAGGPETSNPVGVRTDGRDMYGSTPIPNLQPTGLHLSTPEETFEPINFGPIAPNWRARRDKLGRHAASWSDTSWNTRPLPEDMDPGYFNVAPRDQQIPEIRDNERIVLENLHPEHARLVTNLPGAHPQAFVARPGAAPQELALKPDTLWIDTDRSICTLTWRGQVKVNSPTAAGRVVIAMAKPGQRLTWAEASLIEAQEGSTSAEGIHEMTIDAFPDPEEESDDTAMLPMLPLGNALPFIQRGAQGGAGGGPPAAPKQPPPVPSKKPTDRPSVSVLESQLMKPDTSPGLLVGDASPPWLARGGAGAPSGAAPPPAPPQASPGSAASLSQTAPLAQQPPIAPPAPVTPPPMAPPAPVAPPAMAQPAPVAPPPMAPPAPVAPPPMTPPGPIAPPPAIAPPPLAYSAASSSPIAPPLVDSPWASGAAKLDAPSGAPPLARPSSPGITPAPPPPRPSSASSASIMAQPTPPAPPAITTSLGMTGASVAAGAAGVALAGAALSGSGSSGAVPGGAVAASNAAANATAWSTSNPAPLAPSESSATATARPGTRIATRDVVDLLWFDPAFVDRIREEQKWKELIASLKPKATFEDDPFEDAPVKPPEKEKASEERRDVFGVLTRAQATDIEGVNEAIADGVAEDGTFNRPLLVLSGDLTFPFDELETLKATVTAVTPLIANDKKLKETVDTVNELLKTPWLQSSSGVAEGLTVRVKDAFAQGNRMLPPSYLDTHTERMLLEQRHYQKRTVFGEVWIRSLLLPLGASQSIPAYLPESLSKKLPMFQTMKVRMIAEAHLQQDQYETHPSSLRVVALGRVAMLTAGKTPGVGKV